MQCIQKRESKYYFYKSHDLAYQHARTALRLLPVAYWRLKGGIEDPEELPEDKY